ncbi:TPA: hypothetical protein N0F65_001789 [Lagenidium giganteum]|uniref:Uncharacterized protein n=1 Tax=Lagenidium giganteum TaxID=4803 RepID=A0AAV2Z5D6_9STRA|nr:TPA: hypothetical protein N0F65_001789 [Lagenidium giganteum]
MDARATPIQTPPPSQWSFPLLLRVLQRVNESRAEKPVDGDFWRAVATQYNADTETHEHQEITSKDVQATVEKWIQACEVARDGSDDEMIENTLDSVVLENMDVIAAIVGAVRLSQSLAVDTRREDEGSKHAQEEAEPPSPTESSESVRCSTDVASGGSDHGGNGDESEAEDPHPDTRNRDAPAAKTMPPTQTPPHVRVMEPLCPERSAAAMNCAEEGSMPDEKQMIKVLKDLSDESAKMDAICSNLEQSCREEAERVEQLEKEYGALKDDLRRTKERVKQKKRAQRTYKSINEDASKKQRRRLRQFMSDMSLRLQLLQSEGQRFEMSVERHMADLRREYADSYLFPNSFSSST